MIGLKITKWAIPENSTSPGWLTTVGIEAVINDPSSVPAQFYDEVIYTNYLQAIKEMMTYAELYDSFTGYTVVNLSATEVVTIVSFGTLAKLKEYDLALQTNEYHASVFVPARQAMLDLLEVTMTTYDPIKVSVDTELTVEAVGALIAGQ